jgi:hypothetical protein
MIIDHLFNSGLTESKSGLQVGDPVIITGNVEFRGKTGDVVDIGRNGDFVVVDLYNHGRKSFHSSDVDHNDYAGSDDEQEYQQRVAEDMFGLDPKVKAKIQQIAAEISDIPGYWDWKRDTFTPYGILELEKALDNNKKYVKYALSLTADDDYAYEDVAETVLNPKDPQGDYDAKRKVIHDLSLDPNVDQQAVQQRRLDLDREAKSKGLKEQGMAEGSVQDKLHRRHQELRKKSGLPDPDYYKELRATYDLPDQERYAKAAELKKKYNVKESQRTQCPECGGAAYEDRVLAEKQDACYHKVRSRYKVWPSAYASGALVQCRKKGAANWGNKSK